MLSVKLPKNEKENLTVLAIDADCDDSPTPKIHFSHISLHENHSEKHLLRLCLRRSGTR